MPGYYPPVGFHFKAEVLGLPPNDNDVRFTDVIGLSTEFVTEEIPEGGENRFVQKYPTRTRFQDLTLKRGLLVGSAVLDWILQCLDLRIEPKSIDVKLLNHKHEPLLTWHLVRAYPVKWSVADLNAAQNSVLIESLQLYYQYFTMDRS